MSAMLGIVRGHHGVIHIDSSLGKGTRFSVLFPLLDSSSVATSEAVVDDDVPLAEVVAGRTVLVVEDEEDVRELAVSLLRMMGCVVLEAVDGEEGLELFQQYHERIDLVLLDLTMPKVGGEACCHIMASRSPMLPIVIVSGYSSDSISQNFHQGEVAAFIQKPYRMEQFMDTIRPLLHQKLNGDF